MRPLSLGQSAWNNTTSYRKHKRTRLLLLMMLLHYLCQFHLMSPLRLCKTVWNQTKPSRGVLSSVWTINLVELIELCLKTTYFFFLWRKVLHTSTQLCHGVPPVSPIVANLCMEAIKKQVLHTYTGTPPRLWLCYVDNTFVGLPQKEIDPFF